MEIPGGAIPGENPEFLRRSVDLLLDFLTQALRMRQGRGGRGPFEGFLDTHTLLLQSYTQVIPPNSPGARSACLL